MYTIEKRDNKGNMLIIARNQTWTKEDCECLEKEENIFFNKGIFAIQKIPKKSGSALLRIGIEDDGFISFNDNCTTFDAYWLTDLIEVLNKATENKEV